MDHVNLIIENHVLFFLAALFYKLASPWIANS